MEQKKLMLVSVVIVVLLIVGSSVVTGIDFTGFSGWFKAFDKTLSRGSVYDKNITVRKYYNATVRFRKGGSTSYLTMTDDDAEVELKDASGNAIASLTGLINGKAYIVLSADEIDSIISVTATSISDYDDVAGQLVNESTTSTIGTRVYITVTVHDKPYETSVMRGYVLDDLTGDAVSGLTVAAFEDSADTSVGSPFVENVTMSDGGYVLSLELENSKALDVYVDGYKAV